MIATTFDEFHTAVHGYEPFPWLSALASEALTDPAALDRAAIDVPTGLGKTSMIDLAVWLAAATGCEPGTAGRRRICFLIDRRIVVDDAFRHADTVRRKLNEASGTGAPPALVEVADALRSLWGAGPEDEPLSVTRMRGGVTWDWRWLDRPDRPAVIVGTVDQLGSRLLFRGYGTSARLAPIDAALVGCDSIFLIDEAHLCAPLLDTLGQLNDPTIDPSGDLAPRPLVATLSATQGGREARRHSISRDDWDHAEAGRRLRSPKALHLVDVDAPPKRRAEACVAAMVAAVDAVSDDDVRAVGVVCNTVGRARRVFEELRASRSKDAHVLLLTGRVRPSDREVIQERLRRLAGVDRDRGSAERVFVVATQTIEVGVNVDFDALVTETTSWDALVQRLGRLNRIARHQATERPCPAVAVHDRDPSPLYGERRGLTWDHLTGLVPPVLWRRGPITLAESLPVSPGELLDHDPDELASLVMPPELAPVVIPAQLDDWTRTSPRPNPDTPVEPFLHGRRDPREEVHLVWRSDLGEDTGQWRDVVADLPPAHGEMLSIPIGAVRRWWGQLTADDFDDTLGIVEEPGPGTDRRSEVIDPARAGVIWRDGEGRGPWSVEELAHQLRPDDIVILPAGIGGCDELGWAPRAQGNVTDLADLGASGATLRLEPRATLVQTLRLMAGPDASDPVSAPIAADSCADCREAGLGEGATFEALVDAIEVALKGAHEDEDPSTAHRAARHLWRHLTDDVFDASAPDGRLPSTIPVTTVRLAGPSGPRWVLRLGGKGTTRRFASDDAGPATTSATGSPVTLEVHQRAVERRARAIATNLGLPATLVDAVAMAAAWHDVGKLDDRFQAMLHGGDRFAARMAAADGKPLGKSGLDPADRSAFRAARRASGLPPGFRPEVGSAPAVRARAEGAGVDLDLVVHLVGAHHGNGRPLFPPVVDAGEQTITWEGREVTIDRSVTVDWESPGRFATLNRTYGRWGLALLEAIVRLSDIGCSEEGT